METITVTKAFRAAPDKCIVVDYAPGQTYRVPEHIAAYARSIGAVEERKAVDAAPTNKAIAAAPRNKGRRR